jgi:LuxR family quorum-sensing system transcriptional regulator CciR
MHVLASLAAFIDAADAISSRTALVEAVQAVADLIGCPVFVLIAPDTSGAAHILAASEGPFLDALAPMIANVAARQGRTSSRAFAWRDLARRARQSRRDRALLGHAHRMGLKSAVTVPTSGAGAIRGSCTFATPDIRAFSAGECAMLDLLVPPLWRAADRLAAASALTRPTLTPRQLECLIWAARGKTDWEIARILSVGEDTIDRHLRRARERYEVDKRSTLIVRALFDGTLSFEEALGVA